MKKTQIIFAFLIISLPAFSQSLKITVKMKDGNIITCNKCSIDLHEGKGIMLIPPGGAENIFYDPTRIDRFKAGPVQEHSSHIMGDLFLIQGKVLSGVKIEALYLKGALSGYNTVLETDFVVGNEYWLANERVKNVDEITFEW
jgi:hypothetical protein